MQTCRICQQQKEPDAFYRSDRNRCKECVKASVRANRVAKVEYYREYDRNRAFEPERVALRKKRQERVKANPELRHWDGERAKKWQAQNRIKRQAHIMVGNAIRAGTLKVTPCVRCGYGVGLHAHHEDYSKPLEVMWLCKPCHGQRHREINAERRKQRAA